ncbi:MAG: endonuclease III [Caldisericia bacterium]|nr:endonuclease III [Caldisericia bacterium]
MKKNQKNSEIILSKLNKLYTVESFLNFNNPWELLIATVLSAQCTDKRVNIVTPELFKFIPTPKKASAESAQTIEPYIKSVNYYHTKADNIHKNGIIIEEEFNSCVPEKMEDLLKLKGVGRKTANVVLSQAFKKNEGIAVDTHVLRVSQRTGLSGEAKTPVEIEKKLMELLPRSEWDDSSILLIKHGRIICKARNPNCDKCEIKMYCKYYKNLKIKRITIK